MLLDITLTLGDKTVFLNRKKIFLKDQSGATAIEYAMIAALVSIILVSSLKYVGESIEKTFSTDIVSALSASPVSARPPGASHGPPPTTPPPSSSGN